MDFNDGIGMRGVLSVTVRDATTGKKLRYYEIRNKITFLMGDVLVELLAQRASDPQPVSSAITPGQIFSLRVGTANTPASRADTNLGAFAFGIRLLDVNKVSGVEGELQLIATLAAGDSNGVTLQEAGLFTRGSAAVPTASDAAGTSPGTPRMVAHQIHPPIPKTGAITVEYSWRLAATA